MEEVLKQLGVDGVEEAVALGALILGVLAFLVSLLSIFVSIKSNEISVKGLELAQKFARAEEHAEFPKRLAETELKINNDISKLNAISDKALHDIAAYFNSYSDNEKFMKYETTSGKEYLRLSKSAARTFYDSVQADKPRNTNSHSERLEKLMYLDSAFTGKYYDPLWLLLQVLYNWDQFKAGYYQAKHPWSYIFGLNEDVRVLKNYTVPSLLELFNAINENDLNKVLRETCNNFLIDYLQEFGQVSQKLKEAIAPIEEILFYNENQEFPLSPKLKERCQQAIRKIKFLAECEMKFIDPPYSEEIWKKNFGNFGHLVHIGIILSITSEKIRGITDF